MKIEIYTNLVKEGWSDKNLEIGVGGSEEKLIEFAREMAKDNEVIVYHNGEHGTFNGVQYKDHRDFKAWEARDVFISFKDRDILKRSINARKKVYWSTSIEAPLSKAEADSVDIFSTISNYHRRRIGDSAKIQTDYLWADMDRLDRNRVKKEKGTMLYCSSFDRGLEELLSRWVEVKEKLKLKKLYITYGWDFLDELIKFQPHLAGWKDKVVDLIKKDSSIIMLGRVSNDEMCKLYWKSEYWALPLNNPDSELFCMNAVKSAWCQCIPVVRRIGALQETVPDKFIDFDSLMGQKVSQSTFTKGDLEANKKHAGKFNMNTAIEKWKVQLST